MTAGFRPHTGQLKSHSATISIQSRSLAMSMTVSPTISAVDVVDVVDVVDAFDAADAPVTNAPAATTFAFAISAEAPNPGAASRSSQSTILARASSSSAKSFRSR
ncbi:hypothetical protein GPU89_16170 [Burkholderia cepacia]|nr:hypothetical protein [Burkholderia cepacia]